MVIGSLRGAAGTLFAIVPDRLVDILRRTRRSSASCRTSMQRDGGLLAITLIGIGIMLWARIDDRRKGLR